MNITHAIQGIHTTPFRAAPAVEENADNSFSSYLQQALGQVSATDYADKLSGIEALMGDDIELHSAIIDAQKAEITLNLLLQIRNKLVEAYQEIMRMQI